MDISSNLIPKNQFEKHCLDFSEFDPRATRSKKYPECTILLRRLRERLDTSNHDDPLCKWISIPIRIPGQIHLNTQTAESGLFYLKDDPLNDSINPW